MNKHILLLACMLVLSGIGIGQNGNTSPSQEEALRDVREDREIFLLVVQEPDLSAGLVTEGQELFFVAGLVASGEVEDAAVWVSVPQQRYVYQFTATEEGLYTGRYQVPVDIPSPDEEPVETLFVEVHAEGTVEGVRYEDARVFALRTTPLVKVSFEYPHAGDTVFEPEFADKLRVRVDYANGSPVREDFIRAKLALDGEERDVHLTFLEPGRYIVFLERPLAVGEHALELSLMGRYIASGASLQANVVREESILPMLATGIVLLVGTLLAIVYYARHTTRAPASPPGSAKGRASPAARQAFPAPSRKPVASKQAQQEPKPAPPIKSRAEKVLDLQARLEQADAAYQAGEISMEEYRTLLYDAKQKLNSLQGRGE